MAVEPTGSVPTEFALMQNYPNPLNPSTVMGYIVPRAAHVSISVYNMLGQLVGNLVNDFGQAGGYEVECRPMNQSSGVCFNMMESGASKETRKLDFLK